PSTVFKTAAIDHSAISPKMICVYPVLLFIAFPNDGAKVDVFFKFCNRQADFFCKFIDGIHDV
ncbi:hypothetical protein, partial [Muribaculum intestinale]|uniref:hypothetical protein n=1 Tax=Muribaculum intestinale TaxID=1796646 RepID=UPI00242E0965